MSPRVIHLILLCSILTIGCTQHRDYPKAIQRAESCMDEHPDSALHLLTAYADSIAAQPEEVQMYHRLLTIQAKDKLYIVHTSDSVINQIVKFYEGCDDKNKLIMAYYYQGSIYRDMNDVPKALKAFQKALDVNVPKHDLSIKAYNQMGSLFMRQGLYDEVIRVNRKAIELYTQQEKETKASYAWRDIARMYDMKGKMDSAFYYYKKAYHTALADKDSAKYYGILSESAEAYRKMGMIDSARQILSMSLKQPKIRNKAHIYMILGDVYEDLQCWDSAYYYRQKALETNNIHKKFDNYIGLGWIEKARGNEKQALHYLEKALWLNDSIQKITRTEEIAKINSLYNYQHTEAENNRLQLIQARQKAQLLGLLLVSLAGATGGFFYFLRQKEKRREVLEVAEKFKKDAKERYERSMKAIEDNENKIKELEAQLTLAKTECDQLKTEQLQVQQKRLQTRNEEIALQQEEKKLRIAAFRRSAIYKVFQQNLQTQDINMAHEKSAPEWEKLKTAINIAYPDFTERLHNLCPSLSDKETKVCLLAKTDITPSGVAEILSLTRQAVTNIRTRIYQKVQKTGGDFSNFDHFIESLD